MAKGTFTTTGTTDWFSPKGTTGSMALVLVFASTGAVKVQTRPSGLDAGIVDVPNGAFTANTATQVNYDKTGLNLEYRLNCTDATGNVDWFFG